MAISIIAGCPFLTAALTAKFTAVKLYSTPAPVTTPEKATVTVMVTVQSFIILSQMMLNSTTEMDIFPSNSQESMEKVPWLESYLDLRLIS